ncbi:anti-sigma factor [uncultured Chloroflexus sp.]|uniref:anti-sigma factor family protein n=1 Tax=uncultured Chloroflexus sp. TaxID=214040 RepID=UPI002602FDE6|nr:anti-sigma factor [uncultured Chloroflexus sp.]
MTTSPAPQSELPERDLELLSAYLDNELAPADRTALEQRLASEPRLRRELAELRATRDLLREQPWVTPPRSFTLTPDMAGMRPRRFAWPSWLQPLSGLAALALVMLIGWQVLRLNSGASPPDQPQVMMAPETAPAAMDSARIDQTEAAAAPAAASAMNERNGQATEETAAILASEPTTEKESTVMQQSLQGGGADGIAPGAGGNAGPPPDAQRQAPPPTQPPSPPSLPVVMVLAILILIAAGVWFVRRKAE